MANYTTGTATGPGAGDAFFLAFNTHLLANSWTAHDIISTTTGARDVVWRGAALDATADNRPFIRLTQVSTTSYTVIAYADWDTTTHAGIAPAGSTGNTVLTCQDSSFAYFLWANSVAVAICLKISTSYFRTYLGFVRRGLSATRGGVTKTSAGASAAATSISVSSDMTGKLVVGQKIQIMNYGHASASANATHCETVTITSIAAGSIGVSALVSAYDSGALVGQNPHPIMAATQNSGLTSGPITTGFMPYNLDGSRTSALGQTAATAVVIFGTETSLDPTDDGQEYGAGVQAVMGSAVNKTGLRGYMYGWWACAGGTQALEDVMDDSVNTYIVLSIAADGACLMGPR